MTDFTIKHKIPIYIAGLGILCWFRLVFLNGIWWDDWAWVWQYFGSKNLSEFILPFKSLRHELDGYFLFLNFKLLDIAPGLATNIWSFFKLAVFILNAVLLYYISRSILSKRSLLPSLIGIVYLTSPIVQNLCLVELTRRVYLSLFLLSILLSIKSISESKFKLTYYLSALFFASVSMTGLESFIFFDAARPVIIFYILSKNAGSNFRKTFKATVFYWLPFVIAGAFILIWKIGLLAPRTGVYAHVYDLRSLAPFDYMVFIVSGYVNSLVLLFASYMRNFANRASSMAEGPFLIIQAIIVAVLAMLLIFKGRGMKEKITANSGLFTEAGLAAVFGVFLIMAGLFPYVAARDGGYNFGIESRHGLLASVGMSVFISSIFFALYYKGLIRTFFLYFLSSAVIFLGALQCNIAVRAYGNDWEQQRSFWWQFMRRAPDIKDKTCLLIDMPREEGNYFGGWRGSYEFACPLNLLYARSPAKEEIDDHFAESLDIKYDERTGYLHIVNIKIGRRKIRFETYKGTQVYYPQNLIVAFYRKGRLYLNDEIRSAGRDNYGARLLLPYAAKDRIVHEEKTGVFPFRWIIGPEPKDPGKVI